MSFATTTSTIVSGSKNKEKIFCLNLILAAMAERIRLKPYIVITYLVNNLYLIFFKLIF